MCHWNHYQMIDTKHKKQIIILSSSIIPLTRKNYLVKIYLSFIHIFLQYFIVHYPVDIRLTLSAWKFINNLSVLQQLFKNVQQILPWFLQHTFTHTYWSTLCIQNWYLAVFHKQATCTGHHRIQLWLL